MSREWWNNAGAPGQGRPSAGLGTEREVVRPAINRIINAKSISAAAYVDSSSAGTNFPINLNSAGSTVVCQADAAGAHLSNDSKRFFLDFGDGISVTKWIVTVINYLSVIVDSTSASFEGNVQAQLITDWGGITISTVTWTNQSSLTYASVASADAVAVRFDGTGAFANTATTVGSMAFEDRQTNKMIYGARITIAMLVGTFSTQCKARFVGPGIGASDISSIVYADLT